MRGGAADSADRDRHRARFGSQSSWDEFTQWRWVTIRDQAHGFPF
jgi:hypothetical protein